MSSRKRDIDELIRQKTLLGSRLSRKDSQYAAYAGAALDVAEKLAFIDVIRKRNLFPELNDKLEEVHDFLDAKRKAFFMTVGSDVLTQLAAIVGDDRVIADASKRDIPIRIGP